MLGLPNFDHMTTFTNDLNHVIKFFWWLHGQKLRRHKLYVKMPFLRRPTVANFADIIKIPTIIKKNFI